MTCQTTRGRRIRRPMAAAIAAGLAETLLTWLRSGRIGGDLVVRCSDGHLFTTIWIPGASVKSIRLGWWRIQRCPVGAHWSVVTPVREDELGPRRRRAARRQLDTRLP